MELLLVLQSNHCKQSVDDHDIAIILHGHGLQLLCITYATNNFQIDPTQNSKWVFMWVKSFFALQVVDL